jgi:ABC-type branched-subunit amino acid transport system substrate-binding protein
MSRRRFLSTLAKGAALSCAGFVAHARASDGLSDSTILLGMSSPLTGPTGAYGRQMREGIEACFDVVNGNGGVNGRKLVLHALDDGYEVGPAVANARRLIEQDKVFALMGFYGTASSTAVLPVIEQAAVPLVGTISGAAVLRQPTVHWMFHLRASYENETAAIVRSLTTVGVTRIAVLYQADGFGTAGLDGVTKALAAARLQPVASAAVPRNSADVAAAVQTIAAADPQAVVLVSLYRPSAAFITQIRAAGRRPTFVALSPVGTDQLIAELGPANARGIEVAQVIPSPWSGTLQIVRDYRRDLTRNGEIPLSYYGLEGYINARLVVAALGRCGNAPTREKFAAALRSGNFDLGGYDVKFPHGNEGSSYVEISIIGADGRIIN